MTKQLTLCKIISKTVKHENGVFGIRCFSFPHNFCWKHFSWLTLGMRTEVPYWWAT